ncbi:MAG: hypothetical protein AAFR04_00430 [Pseudomonadota bacterium]
MTRPVYGAPVGTPAFGYRPILLSGAYLARLRADASPQRIPARPVRAGGRDRANRASLTALKRNRFTLDPTIAVPAATALLERPFKGAPDKPGALYIVSPFAAPLSDALHLTQVVRRPINARFAGPLAASRTRVLSRKPLGAARFAQGGTRTPWDSFLGATRVAAARRASAVASAAAFPYELAVRRFKTATITRRLALGRHGPAHMVVMPDRRTVYVSKMTGQRDLFMFLADRAGDLSSGHLYAATRGAKATTGTSLAQPLLWRPLGRTDDRAVAAALRSTRAQTQLFQVEDVAPNAPCPADMLRAPAAMLARLQALSGTRAQAPCFALRNPKTATIAARLAPSFAARLSRAPRAFGSSGALAFVARTSQLLMAAKVLPAQFTADQQANACGGLLALDVAADPAIGSSYVAKRVRVLITGKASAPLGGKRNRCAQDQIAAPVALAARAESNVVMIGEGGIDGHEVDALWAFNLGTGELVRVMTLPSGANFGPLSWWADAAGRPYLLTTIAHPFGEDVAARGIEAPSDDPWQRASQIGLLGPFAPATTRARSQTR